MEYCSVAEIVHLWKMSERGVRNYCAHGKIEGAFLKGKTWNIPKGATKPDMKIKGAIQTSQLLSILKEEKMSKRHGGIYHKIQVDRTFNSNHMEGSQLTQEQTRYMYETNMIGI